MELHQIRYFLSLSNLLNFTAAAEACNVSQPALSRAISQLEAELGGELFRRERKLTHMTDFGRAVLPALRDCFQANLSVKDLARDFHRDGHAPLRLALSRSFDIDLLAPLLAELGKAFPQMEINVFRGTSQEITDRLRNGEVEIAIAGQLSDDWERIESKRLFEQRFGLLISRNHKLAGHELVGLRELAEERLLGRPNCMITDALRTKLKQEGVTKIHGHEVNSLEDIPALVNANFGVGVWPIDRGYDGNLLISYVEGYQMSRWVQVYTVFGRGHSAAAKTMINLLRARDWSELMPRDTTPRELVA
jgi:DNA-binding transcriptional LysR family regulator